MTDGRYSQLGRIKRVDAREIWKNEATDLTPWLQQNIDQLNEAIGFEIELTGREERVGPFAVDLYGKEVQSGHRAIIENQLEPTDHNHLGQIITYAAGLEAGVVVWIAPKFRPEHRRALAWLNEISPADKNFFGVEIEILEVNGQRATNFKLVVEPNSWQKSVHPEGTGSNNIRTAAYQAYFAKLLEDLKRRLPDATTATRTQPLNYFWFAAGRNGTYFSWTFTAQRRFRVAIEIDTGDRERNLEIFDVLYADAEALEQAVGLRLEWERLEHARGKRIATYAPFSVSIDSSEEDLLRLRNWAVETMVKFIGVFRPRLKELQ